jgi:hypothetical protein
MREPHHRSEDIEKKSRTDTMQCRALKKSVQYTFRTYAFPLCRSLTEISTVFILAHRALLTWIAQAPLSATSGTVIPSITASRQNESRCLPNTCVVRNKDAACYGDGAGSLFRGKRAVEESSQLIRDAEITFHKFRIVRDELQVVVCPFCLEYCV